MAAQSVRLNTVASNLANAESVSGSAEFLSKVAPASVGSVRQWATAASQSAPAGAIGRPVNH